MNTSRVLVYQSYIPLCLHCLDSIQAETVFMERAKRKEMERLYSGLAAKPGAEDYEWLRTSWLVEVLSGEQPGRCEHEDLLCEHNK